MSSLNPFSNAKVVYVNLNSQQDDDKMRLWSESNIPLTCMSTNKENEHCQVLPILSSNINSHDGQVLIYPSTPALKKNDNDEEEDDDDDRTDANVPLIQNGNTNNNDEEELGGPDVSTSDVNVEVKESSLKITAEVSLPYLVGGWAWSLPGTCSTGFSRPFERMNEDDPKSSSDNKTEITSLVNMDKRKDSSGYGSVSEAVPSSGGGADDDGKKKASEEKTPKKSPEITQSKPGKSKPNPGFVNLYFDPGTEKCRDDDDDDANKTQENVKNQNQTDKPGTSQPGKLSVKDDPDKLSVSDVSRDFCPSPSPLDTLPLLLDDSLTESSMRVIGEIIVPFLLAGLGCVFAGVVLDLVKSWAVFQEMSEVFILVPALLGLKGNLEMTLASRLSTQANLGNMDSRSEQWKMIYGNLALTQVQAIVVGLLASLFAIALGWIPSGKFNIMHGFLMCAGSVLTAVLATLLLGSLMVGVVLFSRRFHINPDNVATPIAASLGDLTTISLLAVICQALFGSLDTQKWLTPTLLGMTMLLIPLWWVVSHKNKYTHDVLYTGWVPVIGAMFISSLGGLVLDYAVANYNGLAIFQPVINGVGGNLVAVQASRLSTALHKVSSPGTLPENAPHGVPNPVSTFFSSSSSSRTARVLMMMVVPGHIIFMLVIYFMQQTGDFVFTIPFAAIYLVAAVIQVGLLLYIANGLVHCLWARGNDPDNSSIPYLTAIGDLLGTSLLALTFLIISKLEPTVKH